MSEIQLLENPIVIPINESKAQSIGFCEGCGDQINIGEEYVEFMDVLLHEDSTCIKEYVLDQSIKRVAGEN